MADSPFLKEQVRLDQLLNRGGLAHHWEKGRFSWIEGNNRWMVKIKYDNNSKLRILSDVRWMDHTFFEVGNGLGIIILFARAVRGQTNGTFTNKLSAQLISGTAYHFPTLKQFRTGITEGWLNAKFGTGMSLPGGKNRPNPKYGIKDNNIPPQYLIYHHDFLL